MSLRRFRFCLVLATFLVCVDDIWCALSDKIGSFAIHTHDDDKISTAKSVAENGSSIRNNTALQLKSSPEGGSGGIDKEDSTNSVGVSRKTNKNKPQKGFMEKMLPMMVIPFMVSTSIIPMMLISLKIMILKSAFIGKIAILLMLLNMFRRRTSGLGGVFTQNIKANDVAMEHYGYHGDEEYGAYVN